MSEERSDEPTLTAAHLPAGWAYCSLDDLKAPEAYALSIGPFGSNLKVSDYREDGVPLVFVRDIRSRNFGGPSTRFVSTEKATQLNAHKVFSGDLLLTKMGDPPGDTAVYPKNLGPAVITADCIRLKTNPGLTSSRFLEHWLRSPEQKESILSETKGVAQQKLSLKRFREIKTRLPPIPEQYRIVEALDSYLTRLDAATEGLKRVEANLKRYRASVLKAAVEGRLVPTEAELARREGRDYEPASVLLERILKERRRRWEESELAKMKAKGKVPANDKWKSKYKEPIAPDVEGLPELPEGWCWASFDSLLSGIEAGKSFKCDERPPGLAETGVVKVSAVSWGDFDENESKTCTNPALVNDDLIIKTGDFLISRANTLQLVGAVVIVKTVQKRVMLSDKILRLRTIGRLDEWLLEVLRSSLGREQIEGLASGNQDSMRNIGQERIRRITIPLPPLVEIKGILGILENAAVVERRVELGAANSLIRLERLRQSILKWAFEGKLVDQDPNDEPASVLLERIRQERQQAAPKKRPRGRKSSTKS